jgi:SAM-dependent methyltransferase
MSLRHVKEVFERSGREDPLYAVLTVHDRRGGRWDPEEFFARGREEIDRVLAYLAQRDLSVARGAAFDFGCGAGRLSQALGDHFATVVGVDISSSMVDVARGYNRHGDRVRYQVNDRPDLGDFAGDSFDFVYSNITLQHIPPGIALAYVTEFLRILRPGGLAVFQVRIGRRIEPGTLSAILYKVRREYLRRLWQRLRGRIPYEMHFVATSQVEEAVARGGGRVLDRLDVSRHQDGGSLRYTVTR